MEQKCYTKVKVSQVSYRWEIANFDMYGTKYSDYLTSPTFTDSNETTEWYLKLYPRQSCDAIGSYLTIFLFLSKSQVRLQSTNYSITVLNSEGNKIHRTENTDDFNSRIESSIILCSTKSLIKKNLSANNKITIVCKIKSGLTVTNEVSAHDSTSDENPEELFKNLQTFLENAKFSDLTIIVEEKKFFVHKIILSVRSPVFRAMFEHNMKEKNSNIIQIEDAEHEAIAEMLHYIYTGKVENLEKSAYELLILSDRYALEGLKRMCSETLAKNLTIDNALSILNLADKHKSCKLKALTIKFIAKHGKKITDLPDFKFLLPKDSDLCAEVFQALCNINC